MRVFLIQSISENQSLIFPFGHVHLGPSCIEDGILSTITTSFRSMGSPAGFCLGPGRLPRVAVAAHFRRWFALGEAALWA